jgi:uncharacterized protein (TIGR03437 family)
VDAAGNLFIADSDYNRVRKVSPDGTINTFAGNGTYVANGPIGDGAQAAAAVVSLPTSVLIDAGGNLIIAETGAGRIRKVSPEGIITTIAGTAAYTGPSGDGGPATKARLSAPSGMALDRAGNLFIADPGWNAFTGDAGYQDCCDEKVRRISPDGIITTVAGGTLGYSGDGGPASTSALNEPLAVAADAEGNIYIADAANNAIRVMRPTSNPVLLGSVVDAASQKAEPVSPGKIVVIYGDGIGPAQLVQGAPEFPLVLGGTSIQFNNLPAQILYASQTQVAVAVPPGITGATAQVVVTYQGKASNAAMVPVAPVDPNIFTVSQAGWGQAAAIKTDGSVNGPANPVRIGEYLSLYATGAGQDYSSIAVTVDGLPASTSYIGQPSGQAPGLIQLNVRIPDGVRPGGYVPVVIKNGDASTGGAVWIAVGN